MLFRMTKDTRVFKKGQKVFGRFGTGALAALVRGRYKAKGRWIETWVHWPDSSGKSFSGKPDCKFIGYARLDESFKKLIGLV